MWWQRQRRAELGTIARKKTFGKGDGLHFEGDGLTSKKISTEITSDLWAVQIHSQVTA
jgi:hypothetical protein